MWHPKVKQTSRNALKEKAKVSKKLTIKDELNELNTKVKQLETQLTDFNQQLTEVNRLNTRVTNLEKKIDKPFK